MINNDMQSYSYYAYGDLDAYGQPQLSKEAVGTVKMAINIANQHVQDNVLYVGAEFVGLTHANLDEKCVIQYGEDKLKVLYINPFGRFKQVFLARM